MDLRNLESNNKQRKVEEEEEEEEEDQEEEEISMPISMGYGPIHESSNTKVKLMGENGGGGGGGMESSLAVSAAAAAAAASGFEHSYRSTFSHSRGQNSGGGGGGKLKGVVLYKECLKNHAASIGGHALDGCGEFMPSEGIRDDALKCAACGCHRNFHRRHVEGEPCMTPCYYCSSNSKEVRRPTPKLALPALPTSPSVVVPPPGSSNFAALPPPASTSNGLIMAFGGMNNDQSSSEEFHGLHSNATRTATYIPPMASSKKRFRTKFSVEQKDKMLDFAMKVGWTVQKQDKGAVQRFCNEIGVRRHVLKVWMHNNKHALTKKQGAIPAPPAPPPPPPPPTIS